MMRFLKNLFLLISIISIDSVIKVEKKNYPQVFLEQCKYKLKKRKPVDFIDVDVDVNLSNKEDEEDE